MSDAEMLDKILEEEVRNRIGGSEDVVNTTIKYWKYAHYYPHSVILKAIAMARKAERDLVFVELGKLPFRQIQGYERITKESIEDLRRRLG